VSGADELLRVAGGGVADGTDATAPGGERQGEEGERIAHECVRPTVEIRSRSGAAIP
jgi:hypothetical protein